MYSSKFFDILEPLLLNDLFEKIELDKKTQSILSIFNSICLPFDDKSNDEQPRIVSILEELKDVSRKVEYDKKYGTLIFPKNNEITQNTLIIEAHQDLIPLYQKTFSLAENAIFSINEENNNGMIHSQFDNSICVATLIHLLQENKIPDNVMIYFSNGEEVGGWGMQNFLNDFFKEKNLYPKIVCCDVTNDGEISKMNIEFDNLNTYTEKELRKTLGNDVLIQKERFFDNTSVIISNFPNLATFSACIHTVGTIHSLKNAIHKNDFSIFSQTLEKMIKGIDENSIQIQRFKTKEKITKDFKDFFIRKDV